MTLKLKCGQGLIEYLLLIAAAGAIAVPFVYPAYNTSSQEIGNSDTQDNSSMTPHETTHHTSSIPPAAASETPILHIN